MKHMQTVRRYGSKALVAAAAFGSSMLVMAEDSGIAAAAKAELAGAKTDVNAVGVVMVGIVAAVAVIGLVIALVRRGGK